MDHIYLSASSNVTSELGFSHKFCQICKVNIIFYISGDNI